MSVVDVAAISDTGRVREANEDSFLVDLELFIFAVADGMGGHVAGEIASATAIETIRAATAAGVDISTAISNAHKAVKQKSASDEQLSGMGTTLTALGFSKDKELVIAHVGDSRAYVLHRSTDAQTQGEDTLVRITKDHSLVEELVDAGEITEEEANVHPRRSVITRALGIDGEIEVDVTKINFIKGDRYLLCSDGLSSMVRDDQIEEVMRSSVNANECARELVSRANQAGGNDNITVVVIDVKDDNVKIPEQIQAAQSVPAEKITPLTHSTQGRTLFLMRIFLVVMVLGALVAAAYKTTEHFATQGYYLDQKNGEVVLMSGRLDGVLFFEPKVDTQTGIEFDKLTSADKLSVERHKRFDSRAKALASIKKLQQRQSETPATLPKATTPTTAPQSIVTAPISISKSTRLSDND